MSPWFPVSAYITLVKAPTHNNSVPRRRYKASDVCFVIRRRGNKSWWSHDCHNVIVIKSASSGAAVLYLTPWKYDVSVKPYTSQLHSLPSLGMLHLCNITWWAFGLWLWNQIKSKQRETGLVMIPIPAKKNNPMLLLTQIWWVDGSQVNHPGYETFLLALEKHLAG